jgi:phosphatidate cytidylyltransferase
MNPIGLHSLYAMISISIIVVLFFGVYFILKMKNPAKNYEELYLRIKSWAIMLGLLFVFLLLKKEFTILFFAFISFVALKEFLSIVPLRIADRRAVFWVYLTIPIQYYLVYVEWYGLFIIFIPIYLFLFIPIRLVIIGQTEGFIKSISIIHLAAMFTIYGFSHIAYLLNMAGTNENAGPIGLILFILFITQFNDVCQYVWGKSFGKHKIIPKVSPNKTWEGFIGGVVSIGVISYFLAPYLTTVNGWNGLYLGLLIAVCGFFGDVVISCVKRDLRIKDTGSFIPGHGGILDRIDSLLYTVPIFFHFINYFY